MTDHPSQNVPEQLGASFAADLARPSSGLDALAPPAGAVAPIATKPAAAGDGDVLDLALRNLAAAIASGEMLFVEARFEALAPLVRAEHERLSRVEALLRERSELRATEGTSEISHDLECARLDDSSFEDPLFDGPTWTCGADCGFATLASMNARREEIETALDVFVTDTTKAEG
jgi:hypothetical protein